MICGIAGALYVPQVGIINPSEMSPANSIEIAIWTAVGGRGTLIGPVIGAARRQPRQELVHAGAARVLAVRARPAVHPGDAVPAARHRGRCGAKRAQHERVDAQRDRERAIGDAHPAAPTAASLTPGRRHSATARILYLERITRQLRRLQGAERAVADGRRRRAALRHRSQRRRQDHDDGRDHRQDAARRGHRVLRPDDRPHAADRAARSPTPASAASSRSRRCSSTTRCSRTSSSR